MYKEKVVASYIVAVLAGQMLKQDEVDVLLALCEKNFATNNPMVRIVKDMIRGAEVEPNDPEFAKLVYNAVFNRVAEKDPDLKKLVEVVDEIFDETEDLLEIVDNLKVEEKRTKRIILYTPFDGLGVFVTEAVYRDGEQLGEEHGLLSTGQFGKYRDYCIQRCKEINQELEFRLIE